MTRVLRTAIKEGLLVMAILGCALAARSQTNLSSSYAIRRYVLPFENLESSRFTVLDKGVVAVPLAGGIYMPGADRWLLAPDTVLRIEGVACAQADSSLFLTVKGGDRCRIIRIGVSDEGHSPQGVHDLPSGTHDVRTNSKGDSLLIITTKANSLEISFAARGRLLPVGRIQDRDIGCYAVVDIHHMLLYADGGVFLWDVGKELRLLFHTAQDVRTMGSMANGSIWLGTPAGTFAVGQDKELRMVLDGRWGEMRVWNNVVYMLCAGTNELLELTAIE